MPLLGYESLCEEKQKIIVSQDKGTRRSHRAQNKDRCVVSQYQIDGVVIRDGIRCDFLVMNEGKQDAYLIELKGSDIEHAVEQLEETARKLATQLKNYKVKYRIVHSHAKTHAIKSNTFKSFQRAHREKGEFICKEAVLEEDI